MTSAHLVRDVLNTTQGTSIYTYIREYKTFLHYVNCNVGNRQKGVQGVTYFVPYIILGPTVLAKTVRTVR